MKRHCKIKSTTNQPCLPKEVYVTPFRFRRSTNPRLLESDFVSPLEIGIWPKMRQYVWTYIPTTRSRWVYVYLSLTGVLGWTKGRQCATATAQQVFFCLWNLSNIFTNTNNGPRHWIVGHGFYCAPTSHPIWICSVCHPRAANQLTFIWDTIMLVLEIHPLGMQIHRYIDAV